MGLILRQLLLRYDFQQLFNNAWRKTRPASSDFTLKTALLLPNLFSLARITLGLSLVLLGLLNPISGMAKASPGLRLSIIVEDGDGILSNVSIDLDRLPGFPSDTLVASGILSLEVPLHQHHFFIVTCPGFQPKIISINTADPQSERVYFLTYKVKLEREKSSDGGGPAFEGEIGYEPRQFGYGFRRISWDNVLQRGEQLQGALSQPGQGR